MKPIYEPKGRAAEYGELALNIYNGCNHGCTYCFAPLVLKKDRAEFHASVAPRKGIVDATKRQLEKEQITGKLIHLCFTCDPYPHTIDTTPTREIIKAIKDSGNNVQILTKGGCRAKRDFDLLDVNDWFGVTIAHIPDGINTHEFYAAPPMQRIESLKHAHSKGIKTWVSCEPVLCPDDIYRLIKICDYIDLFKIGKLNYGKSHILWGAFGRECERLCKEHNRDYYIKEDLRKEMESDNG